MKGYIYKITSPIGKIYIGQSTNVEKRFRRYMILSCKSQTKLYQSLLEYGPKLHKMEIIEECDLDLLDEKEVYYIKEYNAIIDGLNSTSGGRGGYRYHSEESKKKMSESKMGDKNSSKRAEVRAKFSIARMGNTNLKGYRHTKESIQRIKEGRAKYKSHAKTRKLKCRISGRVYESIISLVNEIGIDYKLFYGRFKKGKTQYEYYES